MTPAEAPPVRREQDAFKEGRPIARAASGSPLTGRFAVVLRAAFELVFLAFLVGIAAFTRDFAHLHVTVHAIPIFPGELALCTLTVLAAASLLAGRPLRFRLDFAGRALLALLVAGGLLAARGLLANPGLAVMRDFALIYYGWFFFLTLAYLHQGGKSRRLLGALLVGAVIGAAVETFHFFASPSLVWGHAVAGYEGLFGWAAVALGEAVIAISTRAAARVAAAVAAVVASFETFLTGYRTLFLVAVVAILAVSVWSRLEPGAAARRWAGLLWVWAAVMAVTIGVLRITIPSPDHVVSSNGPIGMKDAFGSLSHRWTGRRFGDLPSFFKPRPGVRNPDPQTWNGSVAFRVAAWSNAIAQIETHPWLGIGFGSNALLFPAIECDTTPSPTSNCGAAHNTYLTLAMRMGVPLTLLLCALFGWLLLRAAASSVRSGPDPAASYTTFAAASVLLSFSVFGLTGLLFESPYLSPVVWVLAAIVSHHTNAAREREGGSRGQE